MFKLQTEEHGMIRDAVGKLFTDLGAADTQVRQQEHRRIESGRVGEALVELGLLGSDADESMTTATVQAIAAIEAGAVALPYPVLEALAARFVSVHAADATTGGDGVASVSTVASRSPSDLVFEGGVVRGTAILHPFVPLAGSSLVVARQDGKRILASVVLGDASVRVGARTNVESDYPVYDLEFLDSPAKIVRGEAGLHGDAVEALEARLALLAAAETAGTCRRMVSMTRDLLLTRTQFGQPLGVNQALKHRIADDHVRVEALTSAVEYAAAAWDAGAPDAEVSIYAAKHFASRAARAVANDCLQMHGAIGYTIEFPLQLFMRRAHRLSASHGTRGEVGDRVFDLFRRAA